jgi:UDP-2,4-diacetamido-2,4,6-trideoxy-beta-L-altropyranose hydrolase/UDP-4-amino-4,6-dideoxy-N-acetyl-beta-L-altrosamine N-acetyltransferase
MKLAFRTDASLDIGTGHVMRCLALAQALQAKGADCHFICRTFPGNLIARISDLGFGVVALPTGQSPGGCDGQGAESLPAHAAWLGGNWRVDAKDTATALQSLRPDWLVADHYALDRVWEREVRPLCNNLMVIDDLVDRPHDCNLLLDQTFGRAGSDYARLVPHNSVVLAGTRYALLRPEFSALREHSLRRHTSGALRRILVGMGGIDKMNATGRVLQALHHCTFPQDCRMVVLMGAQAPRLDEVRTQASALPWPCEVKVDAATVAELVADCDLAIGAAGGSAWERCALGVPSLLVVTADNQRDVARALELAGAARLLGDIDSIAIALPRVMAGIGGEALADMSCAAGEICDGKGAERVAGVLCNWGVRIRGMREDDLESVLCWRNHPDTRCWMYDSHEISPSEHREWYARAMQDQHRQLLIVEQAGVPLGFVQFTETGNDGVAVWGFYAVPGAPRGSGNKLGTAALDHAFGQLGFRKVHGEVIVSNEPSAAFHRKLGFTEEGITQKRSSDGATCHDVLCFGMEASDWLERR